MIKNLVKIVLICLLIISCVCAVQMYHPRINAKDNDTLVNHKSNIAANMLWNDATSPIFIVK